MSQCAGVVRLNALQGAEKHSKRAKRMKTRLQNRSAGALVEHGKRHLPCLHVLGKVFGIDRRLGLDTSERMTLWFGLKDGDGLAAGNEQIIRLARVRDGCFAQGDTRAGEEVELAAVLHDPARRFERTVDVYAGKSLRFPHGARSQLFEAQSSPIAYLTPIWQQ
jgi:hypothetical protein